jgi:CTP synthase
VGKFIFITGGVLSGLGKGVVAASLGYLLKARGYKVTLQKIDPYLNVDAGTMNPYEHGEVFVTADGKECDLDIGRYERFLHQDLSASNYITTGQVYWNVIQRERHGDYLGKTVQIIPHITEEIKRLICAPLEESGAEIGIVEVGGTVGDIEGLPYLEALRQLRDELPREDTCFVHLTYIPVLSTTGELKTKPTQHSVKELRTVGIQPDFIVARTHEPLTRDIRRKISLFCDVPLTHVIEGLDLPSIYEVPLALEGEGFPQRVLEVLSLPARSADHRAWEEFVRRLRGADAAVRIGIVGKYVELHDAYISIIEAFQHAGAALGVQVELCWVPSAKVEETAEVLEGLAGILVPGGFGERGIEGKILAADYARREGIPYFGICLGMQVAVIAFARYAAGLSEANSTEFDPDTSHPVIDLLPEQRHLRAKGGTMRLGAYPAVLRNGSKVRGIYENDEIVERHRHRYEFNLDYLDTLERVGMLASGVSPDGKLVEIVELPDHLWYIGVQFHPEYTSRPLRPHPLFVDFVRKCAERSS